MMKEFHDNIPARDFDNFQFVNFTKIMSKNVAPIRKETEFALSALKEIPTQYKATIELNILGSRVRAPPIYDPTSSQRTVPPVPSSTYNNQTCCECGQTLQLCPICRKSIETRLKLY
ncbi:E3 ubiquitin-protein ligase RGLG2 [Artemisia annua]|uniref:E3 ubiquitin-protein ligase RGLG2 n=1 Tax=Artemisia annua TaxID=35608 RepID=A0A2U1MED9_ARTAN|nr:E3 ubiquitin-protein ligase RGLG2 [Artemisia annua]